MVRIFILSIFLLPQPGDVTGDVADKIARLPEINQQADWGESGILLPCSAFQGRLPYAK